MLVFGGGPDLFLADRMVPELQLELGRALAGSNERQMHCIPDHIPDRSNALPMEEGIWTETIVRQPHLLIISS